MDSKSSLLGQQCSSSVCWGSPVGSAHSASTQLGSFLSVRTDYRGQLTFYTGFFPWKVENFHGISHGKSQYCPLGLLPDSINSNTSKVHRIVTVHRKNSIIISCYSWASAKTLSHQSSTPLHIFCSLYSICKLTYIKWNGVAIYRALQMCYMSQIPGVLYFQ